MTPSPEACSIGVHQLASLTCAGVQPLVHIHRITPSIRPLALPHTRHTSNNMSHAHTQHSALQINVQHSGGHGWWVCQTWAWVVGVSDVGVGGGCVRRGRGWWVCQTWAWVCQMVTFSWFTTPSAVGV